MIKIIYYSKEIDKNIKKIPLNKKVELNYWGSAEENNQTKKKAFSLFDKLFPRRISVGMPSLEGFIPYIVDGLNIIHNVSWELTKGLAMHEFIKLYETTQTTQVDKKEKEEDHDYKNKRILQIITDQCISEAGESNPNKKSISFVFIHGLSDKQLENAFSKIFEIREKIKELLEIAILENVDRVECVYKNDNWNIEFVNYLNKNN